MDAETIIKKVQGYQTDLLFSLSKWLQDELPKMSEDWWHEKVYIHLDEENQLKVYDGRATTLQDFDLPTLLRILKQNWYNLFGKRPDVRSSMRGLCEDMRKARNNWAHIAINKVSKELVSEDMSALIDLYGIIGAPQEKIAEIISFVDSVKNDKAISDVTETNDHSGEQISAPGTIRIGSMVSLVSDSSKQGAVIGIDGNKLTLFINNAPASYYLEQVQCLEEETKDLRVSLERCRMALTAHQINNPNSMNLYSLNSARIDFIPYQFRPALKMIKSSMPRILIADDVGVGKTIEAGLILKELEARNDVRSVLIICPKALVVEHKWLNEMKRFDEAFEEMDGKMFRDAIRRTHEDEWPDNRSHVITPYSLFSEETVDGVSQSGRKTIGLKDLEDADILPHFDLVIVDEAHNIRNSNTWAYKGVKKIIEKAEATVFLTATPLQNSNDDLYTLLNLLRPDVFFDKNTFNTMAKPNTYINGMRRVLVKQDVGWQDEGKRLIGEILGTEWGYRVTQNNPEFEKVYGFLEKESLTREEKIEAISSIERLHSFDTMINRTRRCDIDTICIRQVQVFRSAFLPEQKALYDALIDFEIKWKSKLYGDNCVRMMIYMIMRQAASCIHGLAPFLDSMVNRRIDELEENGEWYEHDTVLDDGFINELKVLAETIKESARNLPVDDPKLDNLIDIIERKQSEENRRVIVFSSFRNTLRYIKNNLETRGYRVFQIDGSVNDEIRFETRQRFALDKNDPNAIDILLFSEVGCEGLDYQFCDTIVNYDLPWNPMRIEQRIGRIDRRGQCSEKVRIWNLITEDTIDATIYDRCLGKIDVFKSSIGDCSEILGKIEDTIKDIMFDNTLSSEERQIKLEKEADNQISKIKEMRRMEQDVKSLYGFDLSENLINKEVLDSENAWISPENVQKLIGTYLSDLFKDGQYLTAKEQPMMLLLSKDKRRILIDGLKDSGIVSNNKQYRDWTNFLRSDATRVPVVFDPEIAKNNPKSLFLTHLHPLAIQAAKFEASKFPCEIGISIEDKTLKAGNYAFEVYVWRIKGLRDDVKLVAVSGNDDIQKKVLSYLHDATEYIIDSNAYVGLWSSLDDKHYKMWQAARKEHIESVVRDCSYRADQLKSTSHQRISIIESLIAKVDDESVIRMRRGQIQNIQIDCDEHIKHEEELKKRADIHTELLVKGVLHIDKPE